MRCPRSPVIFRSLHRFDAIYCMRNPGQLRTCSTFSFQRIQSCSCPVCRVPCHRLLQWLPASSPAARTPPPWTQSSVWRRWETAIFRCLHACPCPTPTQVLLLLLRCAPSASAMLPKFYGVLTMRRRIKAPGPHMRGADLPPQAIANLKMPPLCPAAGTEHQWRPRNQAELLQPALRSHQRWVD